MGSNHSSVHPSTFPTKPQTRSGRAQEGVGGQRGGRDGAKQKEKDHMSMLEKRECHLQESSESRSTLACLHYLGKGKERRRHFPSWCTTKDAAKIKDGKKETDA